MGRAVFNILPELFAERGFRKCIEQPCEAEQLTISLNFARAS